MKVFLLPGGSPAGSNWSHWLAHLEVTTLIVQRSPDWLGPAPRVILHTYPDYEIGEIVQHAKPDVCLVFVPTREVARACVDCVPGTFPSPTVLAWGPERSDCAVIR